MAGYREHVSVSGLLGVGFGLAAAFALGFTPVQGALVGCLTWVSGMLPDLDSDTGKPIREVFSLLAATVPFLLMRRLHEWGGGDIELIMLLAILIYAGIRYGCAALLARITVHRGMFHSIPAMLIAAEIVFVAYKSEAVSVKLLMAAGVVVGFMSHLLLDEMYSVQWSGLKVKLKTSAGSAFKMFGDTFAPNAITYGLLAVLTYASLVDAGILHDPAAMSDPPPVRQAVDELPFRR